MSTHSSAREVAQGSCASAEHTPAGSASLGSSNAEGLEALQRVQGAAQPAQQGPHDPFGWYDDHIPERQLARRRGQSGAAPEDYETFKENCGLAINLVDQSYAELRLWLGGEIRALQEAWSLHVAALEADAQPSWSEDFALALLVGYLSGLTGSLVKAAAGGTHFAGGLAGLSKAAVKEAVGTELAPAVQRASSPAELSGLLDDAVAEHLWVRQLVVRWRLQAHLQDPLLDPCFDPVLAVGAALALEGTRFQDLVPTSPFDFEKALWLDWLDLHGFEVRGGHVGLGLLHVDVYSTYGEVSRARMESLGIDHHGLEQERVDENASLLGWGHVFHPGSWNGPEGER